MYTHMLTIYWEKPICSSTPSAPAAMLSWAKGTCAGPAWHRSGPCGSDGQALTVPNTNENEQADWTKKKGGERAFQKQYERTRSELLWDRPFLSGKTQCYGLPMKVGSRLRKPIAGLILQHSGLIRCSWPVTFEIRHLTYKSSVMLSKSV